MARSLFPKYIEMAVVDNSVFLLFSQKKIPFSPLNSYLFSSTVDEDR